jgi:HlyD family secretion protein
MNNAGTVLLTVADMSVIQAEVEVDETNIPTCRGTAGQDHHRCHARAHVQGHVTEIGTADPANRQQHNNRSKRTNFKVVVVLDEVVPDVRPGFTCTADITTATRSQVVAVPIPAVAVRELIYDAKGGIVKQPRSKEAAATSRRRRRRSNSSRDRRGKKPNGVYPDHGRTREFLPIKIGIAGDRYFECAFGAKSGDQVITARTAASAAWPTATRCGADQPEREPNAGGGS